MKSFGLLHILAFFAAGGIVGEFCGDIVNDKWKFIGLIFLVTLDAVLASIKHWQRGNFKTGKAMIFLGKITLFCSMIAVLIMIGKGFDYLDWLDEAVMFPVIASQILSSVKHAQAINLIDGDLVRNITKRVDVHKDVVETNDQWEK